MKTHEGFDDIIRRFRSDAEKFDGDKALFWAGRMSNMIGEISHATPCQFSKLFVVLDVCKQEYDRIIFGRT